DIEITDDINELKRNIQALLPETDFTNKLSELLTESYQPGFEHRKAFSKFLLSLFPDSGLIIFGSNFSAIKDLSKSVFRKSVTDADEIQIALSSQSSKLEDGFHSQVVVGSSNLFYINDDGARIKIDRDGTNWIIEGNRKSTDEIVDLVDEHPERFSPNVFLRPVLQDYLLPTIGYVAGPGELAYYGQMKELYPFFGMEMPIIFPRLSATIIESNIERIMDKLPFSLCEYSQRIEDLESAYVDQTNTLDIEGVFASWKENIEDVSDEPAEFVKNIDPTLEGTTAKVITGFENELNKLKGKVYRAVKQQEQTQLDRIAKIQSQIFPDGLQERSVNPVYFMNKYGLDVWQKMLDHYREHQPDYTSHHIYKI
ncbi:MAG TPA: bacillithiol biosynthesis cysteine-adding enzyme BshC, partial [Balneolaceae bacterium]|nr:bacillithiol biosynthesis cysteine-adding enzyme BshC [Balneolaceae bacterium]